MTENFMDLIIDDLLGKFNFDRVQKIMEFLNWEYFIDGEHVSPSTYQIIKTARKLLERVLKTDGDNWVHSGGFLARKECGTLFLDFTAEFADTNFEGEDSILIEDNLN